MEDISNIMNIEHNENRPFLDNHKVNDNDILNGSPENKLSAAESVAFLHSSPLTEKQVLTSVNNNLKNEKPNSSFTDTESSIGVKSNNSGENVAFLSSEAGTTKAENINTSCLAFETRASIETSNNISCNSVQNNSGCGRELNDGNDTKSAILNSMDIPVGNVNFPPDVLSDKVFSDNQKNLSVNAEQYKEMSMPKTENIDFTSTYAEEIKDEKNNSYVVVPDFVDFSFREQGNVTGDLLESFSGIDSLSKQHEPSPNCTHEEISSNDPAINVIGNKPLSTSAELLETDFDQKIPTSTTKILEESVGTESIENCRVLGHSVNANTPLKVYENPVKEVESNVLLSDSICVEFEKLSIAAEGVSALDSSLTNNDYIEINSDERAFEVPENTSGTQLDEVSPLKVEKVSFGMSDESLEEFADPEYESKVPETLSNHPVEQLCNPDFASKEPEASFKNSLTEKFSDSDFTSKVPSNNSLEQFSNPDFASKVPEVLSNNTPEQFSNLDFASKVPEAPLNNPLAEQFSDSDFTSKVPSNNPLEQFSNTDFATKVPEALSNNPPEQFSDPNFAFKVPDVPSNNPLEQFSDPDFAFKVPDIPTNNALGQFSSTDFAFKMPTNEGDEQFVDAVQFFKDPNSFQFLENIRTSTVQPGPPAPRSSLYVNFDPLHSKFQANVPRQDNCAIITAAVRGNDASADNSEKCSPDVVNKHLVDVTARESLGNILISFDSPKSSASVDSKVSIQTPTPPKMFTDEEVQQKLKIHELGTQDAYIKKQREMEMEIAKRDQLLKFQRVVIEEFCGISAKLSDDVKCGQEKIISLEAENEKLKEDLKTSAEDLQSVENTFTDFYKRYEQCKGMLKTYKDNEEHLKQTILDLHTKAKEQEQMYNMLQERTEEMLEKANVEMDNVKRSGEAQVTVLKAQLKKAEMKISSLESDIKQIKIENSQLGGICDDLMAKVSRS